MRKNINFNYDWQFKKPNAAWEAVTIPHTIKLEGLDEDRVYRNVCLYKKQFNLQLTAGQRAFLEFEGVMTTAKVYVNGRFICKHEGGYTPFVIDVTEYSSFGQNEITVEVDNREKKNVPPGRPVPTLDFLYYSGIYRNVKLTVVDVVYVTNPIHASKVNGGGIYVETRKIVNGTAEVYAKVNIAGRGNVTVRATIANGGTAEMQTKDAIVRGDTDLEYVFRVPCAKLWSPKEPNLYSIEVVVSDVNQHDTLDNYNDTFGIRIAEIKNDGFYLNGEMLYLNGTNRHQQYPYIGIAASDEAQYRDAYKLKQMGANIIRLSHYAQSQTFYKACDTLGMIVINQVPGWQYCRYGKFRRLSVANIQDMMRRDRNHACHLIMETGLNETVYIKSGATDKFFQKLVSVCKAEGKVICYGSPHGRRDWNFVKYDMISAFWEEKTKTRPAKGFVNTKCMVPEYGDFEFGGFYSTSRADSSDGEKASLVQAWNFQWSYNMNLANTDALGQCTWEGIDHVRGYDKKNPISKSGMLDIFRHPKFVYYLYQSQKERKCAEDTVMESSVFNYKGQDKIVFYSNCDRIALFDGDNLIAEQTPDRGEDKPFIGVGEPCEESVLYWTKNGDYIKSSVKNGALARHTMSCLYDGGNCKHIHNPPFTFSNLKKYPKLTAKGYSGEEVVSEKVIQTCEGAARFAIAVDYSGKKLVNNNSDFVFVSILAVDKNGIVDCAYHEKVVLQVENGSVIYSNVTVSESGVATFLVRANRGVGTVKLSVVFACQNEKVETTEWIEIQNENTSI